MSVRVRVVRRARRQIDEADRWWREHSATPDLLETELSEASSLLMRHPKAGYPFVTARRRGVLHLLLKRTQYQIFYTVAPDKKSIEIVSFWHTSRGSGPPL